LLGDRHGDPLVTESRQYFHQPAQEQIAGHQQEEQNDDRHEQPTGEARGAANSSSDRPDAMEVGGADEAGCTASVVVRWM